jgi:hypothetical protein
MDNKIKTYKKSFALFLTIIAVNIFAFLSISIVENSSLSSTIDTLKYLHLQANIHLEFVKKFIKTNTEDKINNLKLNDGRFILKIIYKAQNKTYHISIKSKDDNIRVCDKVVL